MHLKFPRGEGFDTVQTDGVPAEIGRQAYTIAVPLAVCTAHSSDFCDLRMFKFREIHRKMLQQYSYSTVSLFLPNFDHFLYKQYM